MGPQDNNQVQQAPDEPEETPFSNAERLTLPEWLFVGLVTVLFAVLAPRLWEDVEPVEKLADARMPHDLSEDYWLFERYARRQAERHDTFLLGDSVVWGEYVKQEQTLSHYLNVLGGQERCANLGLDGAHPLALSGLVEYYSRCITGKNVLLQCNPLWLTSPKADLQDDRVADFNHPRLVPQFRPWIPAYHADLSTRIGVEVERRLTVNRWATHLQQVYYDRTNIPSWTMEHPYQNPLEPLLQGPPALSDPLRHLPLPWDKSGITKQDYPWVDLDTSLQWQAFRRTVQTLRDRGNRVFVLVGPFNEHHLDPASLQRYQQIKAGIAAWLGAERVPHAVPPPLPSALYGDASHPLAEGYERLARQLLEDPFFRSPAPARQGGAK